MKLGLIFGALALASAALADRPVVCIDPGHPSEIGAGCRGKKTTEIEVAWQVGQRLRKLLEAVGVRVVMTKRHRSEKVTNRRRAEIANESQADLMLRLHCDAVPKERGFATFYPDRAGRDGKFAGPSPEVLKQVAPMAKAFHTAWAAGLRKALPDRGMRTDRQTKVGGEHGALIGSIHSRVPSILVEMCVLTNPKDEAFIVSPAGRDKMANALLAGIRAALRVKLRVSPSNG